MSGNSAERRRQRRLLARLGEDFIQRMDAKESSSPAVVKNIPQHSLLGYLRAFGAVGVILGGAGMFLTTFFWEATIALAIGCVLWILDILLAEELPRPGKIILASVIALISLSFARAIVFFPAPLDLTGFCDGADYKEGSEIEGVTWRDGMSRPTLYIKNPSQRDYTDADLVIWISEGVVMIKQKTAVPCEPLSENVITPPPGFTNMFFWGQPYRFRCDKVPKLTAMEFVAILRNVDPLARYVAHPQDAKPPSSPSEMFGLKRKPKAVGMTGGYTVTYRPHKIDQLIKVQ